MSNAVPTNVITQMNQFFERHLPKYTIRQTIWTGPRLKGSDSTANNLTKKIVQGLAGVTDEFYQRFFLTKTDCNTQHLFECVQSLVSWTQAWLPCVPLQIYVESLFGLPNILRKKWYLLSITLSELKQSVYCITHSMRLALAP